MSRLLLILLWLFTATNVFAQTDAFIGTWRMQYQAGSNPINIELSIGNSEKGILYPAHLKLDCDSFHADYQLLLVKKTIRELSISKVKYPDYERPFSLKDWPVALNGFFDLSRNLKGIPTLSTYRMPSKQMATVDTNNIEKRYRPLAMQLKAIFEKDDLVLQKINDSTWDDGLHDHILSPHLSAAYFGLTDTVYVQQADGNLDMSDEKRTNTDIVSVTLNGHSVVDQQWLNKQDHAEWMKLDTGLNILAFFAENFGNEQPNKGYTQVTVGDTKLNMNFARRDDSAASFIVARLYYAYDKSIIKDFANYTAPATDTLGKNDRLIGSLRSTSAKLTFAVWDDAVEDGDTVSIKVGDEWAAHYFPVKKKTQYITITLKPGLNTITYIAENLGSIPPNTSIIEIIDGSKRRSYSVASLVGENNLIRIFYDVQ